MLKNISNLEGAQKLTKNEQKSINGGGGRPELCENDITTCYFPKKCTLGQQGWYCA